MAESGVAAQALIDQARALERIATALEALEHGFNSLIVNAAGNGWAIPVTVR